MSVRNGREFLAIPGPTTVPDEVLNAMHRPAIEIYSGALLDVTTACLDGLRRVFGTAGRTYIYAAHGHGARAAAAINVLAAGGRAIGPTGRPFTEDGIGAALATRDLMAQLRETGDVVGGNPPFGKKDRSRFLGALDAAIQAARRGG